MQTISILIILLLKRFHRQEYLILLQLTSQTDINHIISTIKTLNYMIKCPSVMKTRQLI